MRDHNPHRPGIHLRKHKHEAFKAGVHSLFLNRDPGALRCYYRKIGMAGQFNAGRRHAHALMNNPELAKKN